MENDEVDFSNHERISSSIGDLPSCGSMSSFFDDVLLNDTHACTHIHTCNPPGPDSTHTHTCFHVHTQILPPPNEEKQADCNNDDSAESVDKQAKKRSFGNREAVRRYREKKKARAASLEDEIVRLKALNHHLFKRLQDQKALEIEAARLKCLLVDIRGRIEGEIGSFPYQRPVKSANILSNIVNPAQSGSCPITPCGEIYPMDNQHISGCNNANLNCFANVGVGSKEFHGYGPSVAGNLAPTANSPVDNQREGTNYEATAS